MWADVAGVMGRRDAGGLFLSHAGHHVGGLLDDERQARKIAPWSGSSRLCARVRPRMWRSWRTSRSGCSSGGERSNSRRGPREEVLYRPFLIDG